MACGCTAKEDRLAAPGGRCRAGLERSRDDEGLHHQTLRQYRQQHGTLTPSPGHHDGGLVQQIKHLLPAVVGARDRGTILVGKLDSEVARREIRK